MKRQIKWKDLYPAIGIIENLDFISRQRTLHVQTVEDWPDIHVSQLYQLDLHTRIWVRMSYNHDKLLLVV